MIDMYLTDEIDITHIVVDEWGVSTKTVESGIKSRVEDVNTVVNGANGKEMITNTHIICKPSQIVTYEDRVTVKKLVGAAFVVSQKECEIKKLARAYGFGASHWEIWI
jgi:hypothetical protein